MNKQAYQMGLRKAAVNFSAFTRISPAISRALGNLKNSIPSGSLRSAGRWDSFMKDMRRTTAANWAKGTRYAGNAGNIGKAPADLLKLLTRGALIGGGMYALGNTDEGKLKQIRNKLTDVQPGSQGITGWMRDSVTNPLNNMKKLFRGVSNWADKSDVLKMQSLAQPAENVLWRRPADNAKKIMKSIKDMSDMSTAQKVDMVTRPIKQYYQNRPLYNLFK